MKLRENLNNYYQYQNNRSGRDEDKISYREIMDILSNHNFLLNKLDYILDIGTRRGNLVKTFINFGYFNTIGIDIGENAAETWKVLPDHIRKNLMRMDIHEAIFNNSFRLIVMSHVIEHLFNPDKAMNIIKNNLDSNSVLIIRVPLDYEIQEMKHSPHFTFFESTDDFIYSMTKWGFTTSIEMIKKDGMYDELTVFCTLQ